MRRRLRRGLTLMDTMISISVLVFIGVVTSSVMASSVRLNHAMEEYYAPNGSARSAMSRVRRDLQLAFLTSNLSQPERYRTVFVGYDDDPDALYFATLNHQRLYRDSRESDQSEITIWAEPMPDRSEGHVLYLRESPRIDAEPDEGGKVYPLVYNVESFELRYLDGQRNEWVTEWDSRKPDFANRLPRAVEIALVVLAPDPNDPDDMIEQPHLLTVLLEYAPPVVRQAGAEESWNR